jgi:hypothetical protein
MITLCSYYNAVIHNTAFCRKKELNEGTGNCHVYQLQSHLSCPGQHPFSKMSFYIP